MLAPFYFMFVVRDAHAQRHLQPAAATWFGDSLMHNFKPAAAERAAVLAQLRNSVYVGLMAPALSLFFCSLAGYAFAMYEFRFKKAAFAIVMATMLLPPFLGMIPTFMVMDFLGWLNQPRALYLPGAAGAFGIFLMRQYIGSAIPKELVEAARMDGCGEFRIYWNIVPAAVHAGAGHARPDLVHRVVEQLPRPADRDARDGVLHAAAGAALRCKAPVNTEWGAVMAGSAVAVLPLLVLFVLSSRRLIDGLTAGAVKS
jgi:multiple sugar transport system permease protein